MKRTLYSFLGLFLLAVGYTVSVPGYMLPAWAQNVTCALRPPGDSTNACASTSFVTRAISGLTSNNVCITSAPYNAVGDWNGVSGTDNTAAINAALAANKSVCVPAGNFGFSGTIGLFNQANQLVGVGRNVSILTQTTAATPAIELPSALNYSTIRNLTLTRAVTATAGGDGIKQTATLDNIILSDLLVTNHYIGINLGATGYSRINNTTVTANVSHGIQMSSKDGGGTFQWSLNDVTTSVNGGHGILVDSTATTAGATLGNWVHVSTFSNTGNAFRFLGATNKPINAIKKLIYKIGF